MILFTHTTNTNQPNPQQDCERGMLYDTDDKG